MLIFANPCCKLSQICCHLAHKLAIISLKLIHRVTPESMDSTVCELELTEINNKYFMEFEMRPYPVLSQILSLRVVNDSLS